MTNSALGAAVLTAAALAIPGAAFARPAAPLVPTALVEEVKSASAGIEFMDYVGVGDVIKLEPSDLLVLSYLKSCEHEIITGGTVRVGTEQSETEGGKVGRRPTLILLSFLANYGGQPRPRPLCWRLLHMPFSTHPGRPPFHDGDPSWLWPMATTSLDARRAAQP